MTLGPIPRLYLRPDEMAARRGTIPSLDGLRAISITLVLLAHFVDSRFFPGGLGVYVFFIISGFLITRLLLAEQTTTGRIALGLFYARRICRLYPVIIVFAVVVVGLDIILHRPYNLLEPASALGYFANYLYVYLDAHHIDPQMPFEVFWSLSLEEHFYILLPVTFVLCNGDPRLLLRIVAGLCLFCLVLRITDAHMHPDLLNSQRFYALSQYRLDSIGFGVLLALTCQLPQGRAALLRLTHPAVPVLALAVIMACLLIRDPWFRETWRYSLQGVAIAALVSAVLFSGRYRRAQRLLNLPVMQWIGRLSYSLYVWHEGVTAFFPLPDLPLWQRSAISLGGSLVIATASYYLVEQPFLTLRRRFQVGRPKRVDLPLVNW